jgi:hypothetical protein
MAEKQADRRMFEVPPLLAKRSKLFRQILELWHVSDLIERCVHETHKRNTKCGCNLDNSQAALAISGSPGGEGLGLLENGVGMHPA